MTPLRRLGTYFARHKKSLTLGGLCVIGSATFSLLKPAIVGGAVDVLAKAATRQALLRYSLMLVGASAIEGNGAGCPDTTFQPARIAFPTTNNTPASTNHCQGLGSSRRRHVHT